MRRHAAFLLAAFMFAGQFAQAAECARETERPAFEVEELKSELMVTAISCKENNRYNAFMSKFGPDIASNEKTLNGYFSRNFGRQGTKQHDEYITSLANAQSQQGLLQGTAFCDERQPMFDEVMAVPTAIDLPAYAEAKNLAVPAALQICSAEPEKKGRYRGRSSRRGGHSSHSSAHHGKKH